MATNGSFSGVIRLAVLRLMTWSRMQWPPEVTTCSALDNMEKLDTQLSTTQRKIPVNLLTNRELFIYSVVRGRTEQIKLQWSLIYEGPGRGRAERKPGFDSLE